LDKGDGGIKLCTVKTLASILLRSSASHLSDFDSVPALYLLTKSIITYWLAIMRRLPDQINVLFLQLVPK
jgi:hypothetical protein